MLILHSVDNVLVLLQTKMNKVSCLMNAQGSSGSQEKFQSKDILVAFVPNCSCVAASCQQRFVPDERRQDATFLCVPAFASHQLREESNDLKTLHLQNLDLDQSYQKVP